MESIIKSGRGQQTENVFFTPAEVISKSFAERRDFLEDRARCGDLEWIKKYAELGGFGETMERAGSALVNACFSGQTETAQWLHSQGARVADPGIRQRMQLRFQQHPSLGHLASLFDPPGEDSQFSNPVNSEELLAKKADVDAYDSDGNTALQMAIKSEKKSRVIDLIARGASLLVKNKSGESALTYAASMTSMAMMNVILHSNKLSAGAMREALSHPKFSKARQWIDTYESAKQKLNSLSKLFEGALELQDNAISQENRKTISNILSKGAFTFDAASFMGMNYYLLDKQKFPNTASLIRRLMAEKTPSEAIAELRNYWTAEIAETRSENQSMMPMVCQAVASNLVRWQSDADVNRLLDGLIFEGLPLNKADELRVLNHLRSSVEDFRVIQSHSKYPMRSLLTLAVKKNRPDLVNAVIDYGADVNALDWTGDGPIHVAAQRGNERLVRLLLERGARKDLHNKREESALHLAIEKGFDNLRSILA